MDERDVRKRRGRSASPAVEAGRRDEIRRLRRLLRCLSRRRQELIRLKFFCGWSYRRIGAKLGISINNVGVSLHHAVQRIREEAARGKDWPHRVGRQA